MPTFVLLLGVLLVFLAATGRLSRVIAALIGKEAPAGTAAPSVPSAPPGGAFQFPGYDRPPPPPDWATPRDGYLPVIPPPPPPPGGWRLGIYIPPSSGGTGGWISPWETNPQSWLRLYGR